MILSDVSMLLRDPYALHVLCKSILQCLLQVYEQNKLPRVSCESSSYYNRSKTSLPILFFLPPYQESSELEFLVRLLGLAFKSLTLLETKEYYENKLVGISSLSPLFLLPPRLLPYLLPQHSVMHTTHAHAHINSVHSYKVVTYAY